MSSRLSNYVATEAILTVADSKIVAVRGGSRAILKDEHEGYRLGKHISGKLPYHYRPMEGIVADFASGNSALEAVVDLAANAPTSEKFRNSHCGEILAAEFIESHLGYRRLYSKLTLTTSQNTNVHKMDGLFVKLTQSPVEFLFVEAKSSVLPTPLTKQKKHKSGILKQMVDSLDACSTDDPRFEFARIRDNLDKHFSPDDQAKIRSELTPPGPANLKFMGVSITNASTVNTGDDDFILSAPCVAPFSYYALVVTDLSELAAHAYGIWDAMIKALK
ncbi:Hachiman antiphage defense system protein HamA [Tardiphaga sp. 20_F10_N6_6]|uniref:Hachiman antiphage defense system protein HamA n=1 Tax=Tardiphaga sp. 20_F10_N6_6 TaxID=3240788 RepID=UPI003F8B97F7